MAKFSLEKLPHEYDALEPFISEETLKVHHDKHHQTYCDKFNEALIKYDVNSEDFFEIFAEVSNKPMIRNMGGGFWNHNFYWNSLISGSEEVSKFPKLVKAIDDSFGSFEKFKEEFSASAASLFGSGWTWLAVDKEGKLVIYNTSNQDNFMMDVCCNDEVPILTIDVWEHAYYLDCQNKRPEHIEKFFNVVNWEKVAERFSNIW